MTTTMGTTTSTTTDASSFTAPGERSDPSSWIVLGLGSNLGDRGALLIWALDQLAAELGPLDIAPLYRTLPLSDIAQPDYFNTVAMARRPPGDRPSPRDLLVLAKSLERRGGRRPGSRNGPRPLDIDLLIYGGRVLDEPAENPRTDGSRGDGPLLVPHPRIRKRRFVLAPLFDLAPDLRLPPDGSRVADLSRALGEQQKIERLPWPDRASIPSFGPSRAHDGMG